MRKIRKAFTLVELPVVSKRVLNPVIDSEAWRLIAQTRRERSRRAFTLVELLIVIVIIGIMASFIMISVTGSRARSRDTKRAADLGVLDNAINLYYRENGKFPDLADGCPNATNPGINGASSNQVASGITAHCLAPEFIKGLVPKYIAKLPTDDGPELKIAGKDARGFVYSHYKNASTGGVECYKIAFLNPENPILPAYKSIWDPKRDGGANDNLIDATDISAWAKYSQGCAAK